MTQDPNRLPLPGARTTPRKGKSPSQARPPANTIDNYFNARNAPGSDGRPGAASPAPAPNPGPNPGLGPGRAARPAAAGWSAPPAAHSVASTACQTEETADTRAQQEAAARCERVGLKVEAAAARCVLPVLCVWVSLFGQLHERLRNPAYEFLDTCEDFSAPSLVDKSHMPADWCACMQAA